MAKDKKKEKDKSVDEDPVEMTEEEVEAKAEQESEAQKQAEAASAVDEANDKYLRLMADFSNFKKRTIAEKEQLYSTAAADTIKSFLPIFDDLERALSACTEDSPMRQGVEKVYANAVNILTKLGVETIGVPGEKFDVNLHEAVMQAESDEYEEDTVCDVFEKGYRMNNGKVIRYAKVKVVK